MRYEDITKHIIECANNQINKIAKTEKTFKRHDGDKSYESGWLVNWYIDASYSGSAKDKTE